MTDSLAQATLTDRAILAAGEALAGQRRGLGSLLPFAGPAVMASVAYMDPGNFATNIQAGARYGYLLLWVVVAANLMAMLIQYLSAKLGNPTVDPHGDPIPSRELKLAEIAAPALDELEPGETATFVRISDTDPEMLRFLGERGIVPGTRLELVERQPFDGPLFVRVGRKVHPLGAVLARAMHVEAA